MIITPYIAAQPASVIETAIKAARDSEAYALKSGLLHGAQSYAAKAEALEAHLASRTAEAA